jgi:hypothetical protein
MIKVWSMLKQAWPLSGLKSEVVLGFKQQLNLIT